MQHEAENEHRGGGDGQKPQRVRIGRNLERVSDEGADHQEFAVRDVENSQHAILQVQPHCDDRVEAADQQTVHDEIDKQRRRSE